MLLQSTRTASLVGSALGVMVGCLIGMFPLLFMPDSEVMEAVKRKEKVTINTIFFCVRVISVVCYSRVSASIVGLREDEMWFRSFDRLTIRRHLQHRLCPPSHLLEPAVPRHRRLLDRWI